MSEPQGRCECDKDYTVDPIALAVLFHVTYERLSAAFNYQTRTETRIFDPESSNGKLMIATCTEIQSAILRCDWCKGLEAKVASHEIQIGSLRMEIVHKTNHLDSAKSRLTESQAENTRLRALSKTLDEQVEEIGGLQAEVDRLTTCTEPQCQLEIVRLKEYLKLKEDHLQLSFAVMPDLQDAKMKLRNSESALTAYRGMCEELAVEHRSCVDRFFDESPALDRYEELKGRHGD